jgi:hypothetical protein
MNQSVEKGGAIAVTEEQALMAGDSGAGGFCERGKAEIGQAAPFQSGSPLYLALGLGVNAKAQPEGACAAFGGKCEVCGLWHGIAPSFLDFLSVRPTGEQSNLEEFGGSRMGFVVSHLFAKCAKGWETQPTLSYMEHPAGGAGVPELRKNSK